MEINTEGIIEDTAQMAEDLADRIFEIADDALELIISIGAVVVATKLLIDKVSQ